MKNADILIQTDTTKIFEYIGSISDSMGKYITENIESKYLLVKKYITQSDLITSGKNQKNASEMVSDTEKRYLDKNLLFYLSREQLLNLEEKDGSPLPCAKQSNIFVPEILITSLGMPILKRRVGHQKTQHEHKIINDYADVKLVNDTLMYFNMENTQEVFKMLDKKCDWNEENYNYNLSNKEFTDIQVSYAIHGFGTADDRDFHALRHSIFRQDSIIFLLETKADSTKKLFILLEKNPKFFTILGITNKVWENYQTQKAKSKERALKFDNTYKETDEEKTRKEQNRWRNFLAEEMMNYTSNENEVFCPFTYISANFNELGTIFRASHIKSYSDCDNYEAYDLNNGLLLCANADALFDKHLITINENKELVFSFLFDNESRLKNDLKLNQIIFKEILNEERMKYLQIHRDIFNKKEELRKTEINYND